MSLKIETLDYSVEMIPKWIVYFIGMQRDLRMRKALFATVSSTELSTMALNSKLSKVVSYKKAWERIYVLLKILFTFLRVLRLADSKKSGMYKVFYYSRMRKMSIIKSSSDIDNKELFSSIWLIIQKGMDLII